jgi:hypothetical protein
MQRIKLITTKLMVAIALALTAGAVALPNVAALDCDPTDPSTMTANCGAQTGQGSGTPTTLFGDGGIFSTIVNVVLFLVGAISVIMLVYGGIKYTTSAGDTAKVTSAKNTIMYAIVGLIVAILAFAIVNFVVGSFGS